MSKNLLKRFITSIILLSILLMVTFSNKFIFIFSILILSIFVCYEVNNIYSRILYPHTLKKIAILKKFNLNFFILNLITFFYVFFIFCNFSYEIYRLKSPPFFLYVVFVCFFTDIGGYMFGKVIGGKKLTKISPNKTISGSIGSFIFSIIPLILFSNLGYLDLEINQNNIVFCLLISTTSQLGDLFVSYLKRKAKIKDTGKILPGHGGLLDRVDGILFAVPFSYFLLKLI
ncbi:phosphatidate cytidylyltransferase [Candidatus Pelagibacter bacterium nBUS_27]|uniref:phosphatidate cytidylyltransferase n=1 Tax=Candidatus Pelagibacter bacterium nBUS_27 TaxID=3374188 RepID=UPI003EC1062E